MKKIIFFSIPLFGHVNYGLKIAKTLKNSGYEVIYYSGTAYKNFIENSGVKFQPYSKDIEHLFSFKDSTYNNEYMQHIRAEKLDHISEWYKFCHHLYSITNIFMTMDIKSMEKPDLIIYDSAALWGRYVAEHWKVKSVASCTPYTYPEKYAMGDPERFSKLIFQKDLSVTKANRLFHMLNYNLNQAFYKLSPCSLFEPLSPRADLKLIYTVKEFQAGVQYMDSDTTLFCGVMQERENADFSNLLSLDTSNIYIAFGSIYNNASVFQQIYESCKHLKYNFILNIGSTIEQDNFDYLPDNWKVVKHLNQFELLKCVDAFVSHGGVNSVREAIHWGVPIIVLPTEGDTLCTAEDIKENSLGIVLNIDKIHLTGKAIEEIVQNNVIKQNCKKFAKLMQQSVGLCGITKIIENILRG